jgi:hypothetical protein
LGKHYSFPHSKPDAEPFAVSLLNCVGNAASVTGADVRISRFQPRSNEVLYFDAHAGEFTQGISNSSQQTEAVNVNIRDAVAIDLRNTLRRTARSVSFSSSSSSSKLFDGKYQGQQLRK